MKTIGRREQLARLPNWISKRIEVNRYETLRLLEQAREQIPKDARVLDAGSGEGRYSRYFEHTRLITVDLTVGDENWDYSGLDVIGDLNNLPFDDECFEAVVCIQTLEHVNNPWRITKEIGRVLKPGGRYYLSAPMCWHQHQKPHDYYRYTSFGFTYLLEQGNMKVIEMRPMGGYFWFLSFNIQMLPYWTLPKPSNNWKRLLLLPIKIFLHFFCFLVFPLILYYMDRFDKVKDHTLGWVCVAEKMAVDEYV